MRFWNKPIFSGKLGISGKLVKFRENLDLVNISVAVFISYF